MLRTRWQIFLAQKEEKEEGLRARASQESTSENSWSASKPGETSLGWVSRNAAYGQEVQRRIVGGAHRVEQRPGIEFKPTDWAFVVSLEERGSTVPVSYREWTETMGRIQGGSRHSLKAWNKLCELARDGQSPGLKRVQIDSETDMFIRIGDRRIITLLGFNKHVDRT